MADGTGSTNGVTGAICSGSTGLEFLARTSLSRLTGRSLGGAATLARRADFGLVRVVGAGCFCVLMGVVRLGAFEAELRETGDGF